MYILTTVMTFIAIRGIVKWRDPEPELLHEAIGTLNWLRARLYSILELTYKHQQYVNVTRTKLVQWAEKIDDTLDR